MTAPGWYPDPADPAATRYWDGAAWTPQVRPLEGSGKSSGGKPWMWLVGGLLVVALIIGAILLRPGGNSPFSGTAVEDTNSARPSGSQWNELSPTESPTNPDDPGLGSLMSCPIGGTSERAEIASDGRMHGGGLSFEPLGGSWELDPLIMPWMHDINSQTRRIARGWMSNVAVGKALTEDGFKSPKQTAYNIMECLASSDLYMGYSGRDDLRNEPYSLDGADGWRMTANVYVDNQGDIKGDVVDILVLDTGLEDGFSVWVSCATIDNQGNLDEVQQALESLRVD